MSVKGKKILLGMTGGIACYKIPYLVRSLRKAEAEVIVVMTKSATEFITPLTLETVSNNPVAVEMFEHQQYIATRHIDLAEWADLIMIAPATANCLGKVASGISDDLLTTVICATPRPVVFAPAMNPQMWANKITQKNIRELANLGYQFIQPNEGEMACDHFGVGRMPEPDELFKFIKNHFSSSKSSKAKKKSLTGKKILITAGPTREQIDPVRFISNNSSGKMGFALAEAAIELGG
ncbi:MAG: bifunctional phosphopantothenoylcysteine decarboxylase/phosphopantothenate--cysteine ligase CoaBC, partial [Calditrichaeota bacterium]